MISHLCNEDAVASGVPDHWADIDWSRVEENVRRLQVRIAKATRERNWRKVKTLQRFLTRSFSGRALAVRRVTENRGKRTPGVDGVTWSRPILKRWAVDDLGRHGYRAMPLRRVHIPKANGKKRPLGIPTMRDRAMQALHLLALQPVAETTADRNSYGFRVGRSTQDAIEQVKNLLDKNGSAQWILEADIKGCFDAIDHDWLMENVPMDKTLIREWLKAGVVDMGRLKATEAGTPQGGIISPTLANLALDGLEAKLVETFGSITIKANRHKHNKVSFVRYADDFIITGSSKELLEDEVKPLVEKHLADRGLVLSQEKTRITHIDDGFDFLGWNVRKYKGKCLIQPSKKNVQAFLDKCRTLFKENAAATQQGLIWQINPVIRGWTNYHKSVAAGQTFTYVDHALWKLQWRWAKRRHPEKPAKWIMKRYFMTKGRRNWIFAAKDRNEKTGTDEVVSQLLAEDTKIRRHAKVRMDANPFDPAWDAYFERRQQEKLLEKYQHRKLEPTLIRRQRGQCAHCGLPLTIEEEVHVHHVIERQHGGTDKMDNLVALHPVCHRQIHRSDPQSDEPVLTPIRA
ncbi:group II intron reverse transcriptase/maturase [Kordiimonas lipolytica]|uniref:Group II intron reverse transcriptase/maturase n=1 Tax=Kordiimonas lipolytica TaxID=1662421 RepID=A0ABV8UEA0_9PROT|nr:group II intron reverse transcriptase/maturase [Kordiimonas lipolytica]